ncbi:MAG: thiamine pyrophosphate-dependent dehydrogenase E1 component subunit alpha [Chloroflexi bacterium]|nr:MAG: thiamine pyrophosphate-dependent dehydrogenase E1 component subunit alpha [Chloroflexota bacterium]
MAAVTGQVGETAAALDVDRDDLDLLLMIRRFEETLLDLFAQGKLNGTTHTCLGQEYVPVALRPLLRDDDFVFSNHRGHGHYLARFGDPEGLGGSQHLYRDTYLSTGVQGESLPVAAGMALHLQRRGRGQLAAVFIGDGTWGEGAVYEALNLASLWRLPLLVVVEHNGIAQTTPTGLQMAGTVAGRAAAFGVRHVRVTGSDVAGIRAELAGPIADARRCPHPLVVEFETHRLGPHSKGDDTRDEAAVRRAREHDWCERYRQRFPLVFDAADRAQRERVAAAVREVEARPRSTWAG